MKHFFYLLCVIVLFGSCGDSNKDSELDDWETHNKDVAVNADVLFPKLQKEIIGSWIPLEIEDKWMGGIKDTGASQESFTFRADGTLTYPTLGTYAPRDGVYTLERKFDSSLLKIVDEYLGTTAKFHYYALAPQAIYITIKTKSDAMLTDYRYLVDLKNDGYLYFYQYGEYDKNKPGFGTIVSVFKRK